MNCSSSSRIETDFFKYSLMNLDMIGWVIG
jgi:hypothetical protein